VKPLADEDLDHILTHTLPLWEKARGRHIFITGGTGFFGAWLLESLAWCNRKLNLGLSATVLTRDPEAVARKLPHLAGEPSVRLLQGDVRSFLFPEQEFGYILHAAAPTTADAAGQPKELLSTLVDGTARMLELAKSTGAKRFLYVSSGAVYGMQPENLSHIPEDFPGSSGSPASLDSKSAYAEGKQASEQICSAFAQESGAQFAIARCFAFVGPHLPLDRHFAIGNFIRDALAGRDIQVKGDGTPMRSYLYAADLAIWLWTMLLRESDPELNPQVFNVGSAESISIADLAKVVIDELNPSLSVQIARKAIAGEPLLHYVPDVSKAETKLGLRQLIGLREAVRRTAAWYR
jgi:nucleoside-diphosphate-sugar epimerase